MYGQLDEILEDAEARAEAAALEDRQKYRPFLEAAEKYAAAEGLVVCGEAATRLLLGGARAPVRFDSFFLDLLGEGAAGHAAALARAFYALAPGGLGHYAVMRPKGVGPSGGAQFAVAVDGRDLAAVEEAPQWRGVRSTDVLIPTRRPAQFAAGPGAPVQLACVGPELRLLEVYAALCDPARAGEWGALLAAEAGLRAMLCRELRPKLAAHAGAEGGADGRADRTAFLGAVRDRFASDTGRLLVGAEAIALLSGRAGRAGRLQLVSERPLEAERDRLAALAKEFGLVAEGTVHDPRVPGSPKLRRLTLYIQLGGRREPVVEVFAAAARELVPFVVLGELRSAAGGRRRSRRPGAQGWAQKPGPDAPVPRSDARRETRRHGRPGARDSRPPGRDGAQSAALRIGSLFVLMRFRLVDLWTLLLLSKLGAADKAFAGAVLREILDDYEAAAAHYERLVRGDAARAAAQLLPAAFVGRAEDAVLEQKMEALRRPGRRQEPFMPAAGPAARAR